MAGPGDPSYVREFTRHSGDVLLNLNELRKRHVLTDVTLRVGGRPLQAHKAVLTACSGFFYSIFLGHGGHEVSVLTLPSSIEPAGFRALLDFMYTSRLLLTPGTVPAVLAAASYLQMEHVVESCHRFIQASYDRLPFLLAPPAPSFSEVVEFPSQAPDPRAGPCFPAKAKEPVSAMSPGTAGQSPPGQPASPRGSSSCVPSPATKACNWKKQRFIVLNQAGSQRDSSGAPLTPHRMLPSQAHGCPVCLQPPPWICSHSGGDVSGGQGSPSSGTGYQEEEEGGGSAPPQPHSEEKPYKCHFCNSAFRYKGNLASHRSLHTGEKPYRCRICGAQFNRPANLKTHLRIHSGEKPFKCETCGSRFVQVAHLRAHVLIHTGEKPYPCDTCGTRFRHLQTLKSHVRIHTGEKPYQCEKCNLRFRHKSQLRLHLRQKHGAVTNTKICYKVLDGPHATLC
ncbi:B-cell CLL/lymphoma 6 member B protein isoform X2 [Sphaerodactylus townsendi]|uniref:B-cell CLL/lymphoma 6 member B protein isoform X2 n=1 Tax=Sphaerodactylus townsendi TaxID=933632 RepID=UPI0020267D5D|nr:B-cell CLL/lymphoma 6 member B protein isoform X2 [Sphaerodactylus townsendi]